MLEVYGGVDEEHYLEKNPDVRAAVEDGRLPSGSHHFIISGYFEKREAKLRSPV